MVEDVLVAVSLGLVNAEIKEGLLALRAAFSLELEAKGVGKVDRGVALPLEQRLTGGEHAGIHWDPSLSHRDHGPDEIGVVTD